MGSYRILQILVSHVRSDRILQGHARSHRILSRMLKIMIRVLFLVDCLLLQYRILSRILQDLKVAQLDF